MPIRMEEVTWQDRADRRTIKVDYDKKQEHTKDMEPIPVEEADLFETITRSTQFKDQYGDTVIRYETDNAVKKELRNSLWKTTSTLVKNGVKTSLKNTTSLHGGKWCRYKKNSPIFLSRDGQSILNFAKRSRFPSFFHNALNRQVFDLVDWWLQRINNELYESYCKIEVGERLVCKSYLMCVINFELSGPHYDKMDEIEGLCCVIPFGSPDRSWTGGDLVFRDLKLRFPMKPGDIIFFRSRELLHENLPAEGERRSLVLTTDHNSFKSPGQQVQRIYKHSPHLNINVDDDWDEVDEDDMDLEF